MKDERPACGAGFQADNAGCAAKLRSGILVEAGRSDAGERAGVEKSDSGGMMACDTCRRAPEIFPGRLCFT